MRFLVIGSGGREHALVRALKYSPSVSEVHAVPGSDGISQEAVCHSVDLSDARLIEAFMRKYQFDCVVIGPEVALVAGVGDRLRAMGVHVVGPSQAASQLEGSKVFAKEFMSAAGVPTSDYVVVANVDECLQAAEKFTPPYVLKADGLAAGKGVHICETLDDLRVAAHSLFVDRILGTAGMRAVLEQFQPGYEISYLVLTNGERSESLPLAQDHKRIFDGERGPNTGGMGVVGPLVLSPQLRDRIESEIVQPSIRHLQGMGLLYRGVLYIGLMITPAGPRVIEYNVRFGDPEAQIILPLLDGDWGYVFSRLARGELSELRWKQGVHMACVVLAAPGYPDTPEKGVVIEGDVGFQRASSYFLHAGTARSASGEWVTHGGRVLNAVGMGSSIQEAISAAYAQARHVQWPGLQMRSDIGQKIPKF